MKYKCAYCEKVIEAEEPPSLCPHCNKTMVVPDHLLKRKFKDRKEDREKIRQAAERERERIFAPQFGFGRQPSHLILVLAVLVLIGGALIYRVSIQPEADTEIYRIQRAEKELTALRIALERFKNDVGRYPTAEEGLKALAVDPGAQVENWGGENRWRYVNKIKPDQWRTPYQYVVKNGGTTPSNTSNGGTTSSSSVNQVVSVFSFGPDKLEGTDDDLHGELPLNLEPR